jgi:Ni/Fe-hydrogenase subunit HybB-like protein
MLYWKFLAYVLASAELLLGNTALYYSYIYAEMFIVCGINTSISLILAKFLFQNRCSSLCTNGRTQNEHLQSHIDEVA